MTVVCAQQRGVAVLGIFVADLAFAKAAAA